MGLTKPAWTGTHAETGVLALMAALLSTLSSSVRALSSQNPSLSNVADSTTTATGPALAAPTQRKPGNRSAILSPAARACENVAFK